LKSAVAVNTQHLEKNKRKRKETSNTLPGSVVKSENIETAEKITAL
jgi:hypothetical protein